MEFFAGDTVEFGGMTYVLTEGMSEKFVKAGEYTFFSDGRINLYHTKPLLTLVKRAKKKLWIGVAKSISYNLGMHQCTSAYESLEKATKAVIEPSEFVFIQVEL
jgi:hypothetical protein